MSRARRRPGLWLALALVLTGLDGPAAGADAGLAAICPDAELFSARLLTDICWSCLFPIRLAGARLGAGPVPAGAADQALCSCPDGLGVPRPGFTVSLWEPVRILEFTHLPGCAPTLGGLVLPLGSRRLLGTPGQAEYDSGDTSFHHFHYYAFPLLVLLDLFFEARCNADGLVDVDILYLSELDPTWNDAELAFFTHPEAALVAHPVAQAACLLDAASASAGHPLDNLFWCAGTWGSLYPLSGFGPTVGSRARETSLAGARALAALHRRGLARRTLGNDSLCRAPFAPFLPKSQYRMSLLHPLPEAEGNHVLGASDLHWGMWRSYPGPGEHLLYLLWRWNDCCSTF